MAPEVPEKETLPHLIRRALVEPRDEALCERVDGAWKATSTSRLLERAQNIACAIRDAGLEHGDRVALIAHDCVDWIACDFGIFFAGCVVVPVYPTQADDLTEYILQHSSAKLLFIDAIDSLQHLKQSLTMELPPAIVFDGDGLGSLATFEQRGAQIRVDHPELPGRYENDLDPDQLAVLIYTSGTTGNPKGVMLTHDNLGFDAQSALRSAGDDLKPDRIALSVLPYSHIYEHTLIYIYLLGRIKYNICHDPDHLLADLVDVRPQVMTSVPRIFDRVLAGIRAKAMLGGGLGAKLVPWALDVGRDYMYKKVMRKGFNPFLRPMYAIAKRLVLGKIRAALGLDRMEFFMSGSAALHNDVSMTFLGIGVPILQGYGLTETSPIVTSSQLSANRYGFVGKTIPGVEVKIAEDGEVLTRGRQVMLGYYNDEAATAQAIVDGWFHTGDIGELDESGYLRITDRKKEVFKTSTGKFVSPARVESAIKRSPFVTQAMVVGDGRPHPAALVSPNWDLLRAELDIPKATGVEEMNKRDDVLDFMTKEVRKQTHDLSSYEQIRRTIVIPREFSVASGELSPSMKIKRRVVEERYMPLIDRAYTIDLKTHSHV